jgi:hypothetical protein
MSGNNQTITRDRYGIWGYRKGPGEKAINTLSDFPLIILKAEGNKHGLSLLFSAVGGWAAGPQPAIEENAPCPGQPGSKLANNPNSPLTSPSETMKHY